MANALLIAKRTEKINRIETVLAEYFESIDRVSDFAGTGQLPLNLHFDLIVATDSFEITPDWNFLSCFNGPFPGAKFSYLADEIAPETEMSLRSGGLIFLGSYDHFIHCSQQILGSVADSRKQL